MLRWLSESAARASAAANAAGLTRARFLVADLSSLPENTYDLVTASFLHSPVELPRQDILQQAVARVAPDGHLLITSHIGFPPWANVPDGPKPRFLPPQEELDALALDPAIWDVVLVETRSREATGPNGETAVLEDAVVLIRRH